MTERDLDLSPPKPPEPSIRRGRTVKIPRDVAAKIRRMIETDRRRDRDKQS